MSAHYNIAQDARHCHNGTDLVSEYISSHDPHVQSNNNFVTVDQFPPQTDQYHVFSMLIFCIPSKIFIFKTCNDTLTYNITNLLSTVDVKIVVN